MSKKVIWKFNISGNSAWMPKGSEILDMQVQRDRVVLWALVDPEAEKVERFFDVVGTGNPVPATNREYLGTVQLYDGDLILHIFEILP